jgi:hypothetical protein
MMGTERKKGDLFEFRILVNGYLLLVLANVNQQLLVINCIT